MRVPATIDNTLQVQPPRLLKHVMLEFLRLLILPVSPILYLITSRNFTRLYGVFWILGRFGVITVDNDYAFSVPTLLTCGIFLMITNRFAYPVRPYIRYLYHAGWRPRPVTPPKELEQASVVMQSTADSGEHRKRMTVRLSPQLQGMLVQSNS